MDEVTVNLSYTRKAHLRIKIIEILKYVNIQADNYLESVWSSHSNLPALARLNGSLTRRFGNPRVVNRNTVRWVAFPSLRTSSLPKAKLWGGQVFSGDNPIFVLQIQQIGWLLAYFIYCWWRFEHVHFCLFTQQNPPDPRRVPKTENDTLKNNSQNVLRSILQCVPALSKHLPLHYLEKTWRDYAC